MTTSLDEIPVTDSVAIPRRELTVRATRAGGPGGQHVNKTASRIEVVWNVQTSGALTDGQRALVLARLESRLDSTGNLRVVSSESRSQSQNRAAAEARLATVVARALVVPKRRRATRPTVASRRARLDSKRKHSDKKRGRRDDHGDT
jgi:ribosome-associated protein